MNKTLFFKAAVIQSAALIFSAIQRWRHFTAEQEAEEHFDILIEQVKPTPTQEQPGEAAAPEWTVHDRYGALFGQNPDMIGWIRIDGTTVDYPVMQSADRPGFYLKHDFEGRYSDYGVPYVAEGCMIDPQSDNITIFGHHMKSGKMFGALESYKSEAFFREHPVIRFDTRAGFGTYEVIAAFKVNPADFSYNAFIDATDSATFDEYVQRCLELSFYDTGKTTAYGDKLISLSTCEYSRVNNRLVVVARKIT
jgi:sortase B